MIPNNPKGRGAFVLLEGVDRCGKTTQSKLLLQKLMKVGITAAAMRFPDRTTSTGQIINQYLQNSNNLDDRAIHLLFAANRWESVDTIRAHLKAGTTIVCDRYAYSGVAFSSAKVEEDGTTPFLDLDWCRHPDQGLPAPDCVLFLDVSQEVAEQRGGYGGERYEKRDMQARVRKQFDKLQKLDEGKIDWNIIDASKSIEQVEQSIWSVVEATIAAVHDRPLKKMWEEGEFLLDKKQEKKTNS